MYKDVYWGTIYNGEKLEVTSITVGEYLSQLWLILSMI